jgi:FkbM family methyltransferase
VSAAEEDGADPTAHALTLACFGTEGMADIDVRRGRSGHTVGGHHVEPVAIHFNVETQDSEVYVRELRRLKLGPLAGAATALTRASDRIRDLAWIVNGLPYTSVMRRPGVTAEDLVRTVAGRAKPPFTFVQVGSNDGKTFDPLFQTVMAHEVRGLLIEPVPDLFDRLRATYAGKAGLSFVNGAVAETEGTREFHWVPPAPGDPEWVDQLGSFSRDLILSHGDRQTLADRVVTIPVRCRTLASLVAEHDLDRIDLLHIDAEGYDLAILQTIDFQATWAPDCILYEQKHLGQEAGAARAVLRTGGYSCIDLGVDVFAFRGIKTRIPGASRLGTDLRRKLL